MSLLTGNKPTYDFYIKANAYVKILKRYQVIAKTGGLV